MTGERPDAYRRSLERLRQATQNAERLATTLAEAAAAAAVSRHWRSVRTILPGGSGGYALAGHVLLGPTWPSMPDLSRAMGELQSARTAAQTAWEALAPEEQEGLTPPPA